MFWHPASGGGAISRAEEIKSLLTCVVVVLWAAINKMSSAAPEGHSHSSTGVAAAVAFSEKKQLYWVFCCFKELT